LNIKPCMGHISGTWELLLCEYWRKSMIIGEKNTNLKRLTGQLKLCFLTEIGRLHWNQGEEVAHFAWFGEPWFKLIRHLISKQQQILRKLWINSSIKYQVLQTYFSKFYLPKTLLPNNCRNQSEYHSYSLIYIY
jgi:hypothetical protein